MLIKYFSSSNLVLIVALTFFSNISYAQETDQKDSIQQVAFNDSNQIVAEDKYSTSGDIIKEKKKKSNIKNSLTNREITIENGKTSFKFKYGARVQTRFDLSRVQESGANSESELYFRRVRLKSDGHFFTPKLEYKLEIDVIGGQILDAVLKWNFYKNFVLWAGQTKLRGNRERVISSQNLQFVDRSLLNSKFTLDRDIGFWLMHHFKAGKGVIREVVSVSRGEGRDIFEDHPMPIDQGLDYTARLEYLPFGNFTNKGDYKGSDLEREPKPKLSLGLTFDYNENAVKTNGQKGSITGSEANLISWIGDMMFKYRGFSVMTEYVDRRVCNCNNLTIEQYDDLVQDFYTGTALNAQSGYVFKNNFELAARYTQVRPLEETSFNDLTDYTFALSKYIVGHKFKVQTDFVIRKEENKPITHIYRLQLELSF